jgi:amidase
LRIDKNLTLKTGLLERVGYCCLALQWGCWTCGRRYSINETSAHNAWCNGVLYSNGNCAIRQLGIPTVSVSMGIMEDAKMPVNITFAFKAYDDNNIFRSAFTFGFASKLRQPPGRTPSLDTDTISLENTDRTVGSIPPELSAEVKTVESNDGRMLKMSRPYGPDNGSELHSLRVYVDGEDVKLQLKDGKWELETKVLHYGQVGQKSKGRRIQSWLWLLL